VLAALVGQEQIDQHNANSRAHNAIFSCLSPTEFDRVSHLSTTREIWGKLLSYHEGIAKIKTRLFDMYRREYENFAQMSGESIDALFARFQTIVNKMRANRAQLPYDDHDMAIKLLHALDRKVWEVKFAAIIESPNYETLTVEELFSKLKSTEIDINTRAKIENPSAPIMALVSGNGSSSSFTNPSQPLFALSSLLSITEEQMEVLGDDELALVISRS